MIFSCTACKKMDSDSEKWLLQTEKALQAFYRSADGSDREPAHKCLLEIQDSQIAWQLCWKLLDVDKDVETQYFGACMLYHKISKYWMEIPHDRYLVLKDEIIMYINLYSKHAKVVLSKLCMALAALMLRLPEHVLPLGIELSVTQLEKALSLPTNSATHFVILEYLSVIPEEFTASSITGAQRISIREQLNSLIPKVINMQKEILDLTGPSLFHSVSLKCLNSWIMFGASMVDCKNVISSILNKLNDENLAETASSVLVELLSHPTSFKHENSVFEFLEYLDGLESILRKAKADSNLQMVTNICKILISVGETHTNLLRQAATDTQQRRCLQLVNLILECTGINGTYPIDETCSELTFNFWYTFQDELLTVHPESITSYHYYLRESFIALIQVLFRKVQLPDDEIYAEFSSDEKEMLRCYRQDIQDTVMYVYSLLREQCLHSLTELLKFLLSGEKSYKWQEIEAVLYLLQGTSEFIESDEATYVQLIISLVPRLPSHPKILESAVYMIGSFSEWLSYHPNQLGGILPILQNGISQSQLTTACTLALRDICRESFRSFSQIMSLDIVTTCMDAIKSSKLNDKEQIRCIEIIGYILVNLPDDTRNERQNIISSFLLNMLESSIRFSQLDSGGQRLVQHCVNCFAAYFRSSDFGHQKQHTNNHPLIPCYVDFIKIIQMILPNELTDSLCQDIFNAIHKAVDTIRDPFYIVLPQTSDIIFHLLAKVPSGVALEVSATIIGMLSNVSDSFNTLKTFFEELLLKSISVIESGCSKDNPDIIHGFLVLLNRTIKSSPLLLYQNHAIHVKAIGLALDALCCQESPTVKAAVTFFTSYVTAAASPERNAIAETLSHFGQDLINRVLMCIGGITPRSNVDVFAEVLIALNRHFITKTSNWLQIALKQEGFPSKSVSVAEKENFQKVLLREKVNKRKLKEIVHDFALLCRGLHGLQYTS